MWSEWQNKLEEFRRWRGRPRSILAQLYWGWLLERMRMIPSQVEDRSWILDVGCGSGGILRAIVKKVSGSGIGVDPILESSLKPFLQKARDAHMSDIHPVLGVGEYLAIRNKCISLCVIAEVLDHLADPHGSLAEIHRVLREDGQLLVCQTLHEQPPSDPHHLRTYSEGAICMELRKSGFAIVKKRNLARLLLMYPFGLLFKMGRNLYFRYSEKEFARTEGPRGQLALLCRKIDDQTWKLSVKSAKIESRCILGIDSVSFGICKSRCRRASLTSKRSPLDVSQRPTCSFS